MNEYNYPDRRLQAIITNLNSKTLHGNQRAISILRTANWYEYLCQISSLHTPYGLGKHLQPETYRKLAKGSADSNIEPFHNNLWRRYASGQVIPSQKLINSVNEKYPESKSSFDHPLFHTFNIHIPIGQNATYLFKMLNPTVQQAVFENTSLLSGEYIRQKSLFKTLQRLERCGNIDAMAATIILCREAIENMHHEDAFFIAHSLFRTSIIACTLAPGYSIRSELGIMLVSLIFPLIESNGRIHTTNHSHFINCIKLLNITILRIEDNYGIGLTFKDTHAAIRRIFKGEFGIDLVLALQSTTASIVKPAKMDSKIP